MIDETKLREKLNELFHFRWGRTFGTYPNHRDEVAALIDEVIEAATVTEAVEAEASEELP